MNLEYFIRDELNKNTPLDELADKVVHRISLSKTSRRAKSVGIEFLLQTGFYVEAHEVLVRLIDEKEHIPWPHLIEFFNLTKLKPKSDVIQACLKGAKVTKKLKNLVRHNIWDRKEPQIHAIRNFVIDEARKKSEERKEALKRKIQFLQSNRMIDQEHKAFKEYMKKYPEDQEVQNDFKEFRERWARHYLNQSQNESQSQTQFKAAELEVDPEAAKASFKEAKKLIKKYPQLTYDLAMTFHFADLHESAIELLKTIPSEETFWLRLELYIKSEKFLNALELIEAFEKNGKLSSDDQFALHYSRALCLRGLGKKKEALKILSHIIELQPNYRAAESLYQELRFDLGGRS